MATKYEYKKLIVNNFKPYISHDHKSHSKVLSLSPRDRDDHKLKPLWTYGTKERTNPMVYLDFDAWWQVHKNSFK